MFLSKLSQTLKLAHNPSIIAPFSLNSIFTSPKAFKSRRKLKKKEKIKRYENNPNFKKVSTMKVPDFRAPDITFPVNIPIRYRYVYRPQKNLIIPKYHDFINFKYMSGNEILINLENPQNLRPTELTSALIELGKREGSQDINWNEHEWIKKVVDLITKNASQYDSRSISTLIWAFDRLKITEPLLWNVLEKEAGRSVQKLKSRGFAVLYWVFMHDTTKCTKEFRERLASLLPLHLRRMSPDFFTKSFDDTIKHNLMTEYLFEQNYLQLIWKRHLWYGIRNYPRLIRGLLAMNHTTDLEFWNEEFMPTIEKIKDEITEKNSVELLEALQEVKAKVPGSQIEKWELLIKNQVIYINTKLKAIENAQFWNVVKNDLEYYRQKEKLKLEKQKDHQVEPQA